MTSPQTKTQQKDGSDAWAERGEYWQKKLNPVPQYKAKKRRIIHRPLVLSGHGILLNVDCGTLLIKCGFTHYPQEREEYRFFPRDRQLPSRIVILDGDGSITFDALEWLSTQGVPLVQIDWKGNVSCVGGTSYAANPDFVQRQWVLKNSREGFDFSKWLISEKIANSLETIKGIPDNSTDAVTIIPKIEAQLTLLKKKSLKEVSELLSVEAVAAAAYFRCLYTLPIKWKGIGRKPIPQEWLCVGTRIGNSGKSNQFALHPVNAMLNYAYGVLENQVRANILAAGVDPTIGYIHSNGTDRPSLVFDLMEPLRPIIDRRILKFVLERTFSPDDFIMNKKGICRLHPQFARFVVKSLQDMPEVEASIKISLKRLLGSNFALKPLKAQH